MAKPPPNCTHCGYEIGGFTEALEALEAGALCLLCGGSLDANALEIAVDGWKDEAIMKEGRLRAADEADSAEEMEALEAGPDFGDEGEDEEDPLL
ncbi:MAG: hypothetical protein MK213_08250 [Planctomycetes bacterium]|nr:hypothetical protein [Planctomycetota bacterium]